MNRWDTFTFRVSQDERRLIAALAEKLQRTQSDAVRFVVINAARQLAEAPAPTNIQQPAYMDGATPNSRPV